MRDIKFRAWGPNCKYMWPWEEFQHCFISAMFDPKHGEKVLMQYTGLKDKNGKEIYEGGICLTRGFIAEAGKQTRPECRFEVEQTIASWYIVFCRQSANNIEVIGNIHENPELIPQQEHK